MKALTWMAALFPLLSLGCTTFERLDFQLLSAPPEPVTLDYSGIELREGISVAVIAIPLDGDEEPMDEDTSVSLSTNAPSILGLARGPKEASSDDETPESWNFVLFGASPGNTTVSVAFDGEKMKEIPVNILLPK